MHEQIRNGIFKHIIDRQVLRFIENKYSHMEKVGDKHLEKKVNLLTMDLSDEREDSTSVFKVEKQETSFNHT